MSGKPDANNIGADRAIQNPQDAIEREGGTYTDNIHKLPDATRLPLGPKAPDPSPFANIKNA